MTSAKEKILVQRAKDVRRLLLEAACKSKTAHVGSSLSCVDILTALYFHRLRIDKKRWEGRDIFVLSKAHAALALYSVLTLKGLMRKADLERYFQDNGTLPGHLDRGVNKAIEASTGSLGHGFNMALGMAYGCKLRKDPRKIYALIGDGESEEGSIWEGALFASKLGLGNFTAILDYNLHSALSGGRASEFLNLKS